MTLMQADEIPSGFTVVLTEELKVLIDLAKRYRSLNGYLAPVLITAVDGTKPVERVSNEN